MLRELDRRKSDGIEVVLHWHSDKDCVYISVKDRKNDFERRGVIVPSDKAMDAFQHPFAYVND
jgi:hypothetical protein